MFSTSRNRLYNKRDKEIISDTLGISRTFFHPFCDQFSLLPYRSFQVFDNLIFQCLEGNGVDNKTHNNERQECQYQEKNTEFAFCRFEQDIAPQYYYKYLYLNAKTQRAQRRKAEVEKMRTWEDEKISSSQLPNLPTSYSSRLCGELLFLFLRHFLPISQESLYAVICKRMLNKQVKYIKGNRRNISAHHRCIPHMNRIPNTSNNDLRLESIVVVDGTNLLNEFHAYLSPVIESPDKWTDISPPCLCRQERLIRGKTECYVGFNTLFGQSFYGL